MPEDHVPADTPEESGPAGLRIVAAGGVLWQSAARERVAVVHRHRYDDRCLPKGKIDPGESLLDCALRETAEETGYRGWLLGWAGDLVYPVDGYEKSVVFFELMVDRRFEASLPDPVEVSEVLWLAPQEALDTLVYDGERTILTQLLQRHAASDGSGLEP